MSKNKVVRRSALSDAIDKMVEACRARERAGQTAQHTLPEIKIRVNDIAEYRCVEKAITKEGIRWMSGAERYPVNDRDIANVLGELPLYLKLRWVFRHASVGNPLVLVRCAINSDYGNGMDVTDEVLRPSVRSANFEERHANG